jgi:hypothetical protein
MWRNLVDKSSWEGYIESTRRRRDTMKDILTKQQEFAQAASKVAGAAEYLEAVVYEIIDGRCKIPPDDRRGVVKRLSENVRARLDEFDTVAG